MSDIQKMAKQSETFPAIMVETQCQVCPEYGYCDTCAQGQFRHWMRLDIQYKDLERRLAVAVEALKMIGKGENKERQTGMDTPPISVSRDQLRLWAIEALAKLDEKP